MNIPGYDAWKLRAPEDDRPYSLRCSPYGWARCDACNGDTVVNGEKCEACGGCGGVEVDEDDMDFNEE